MAYDQSELGRRFAQGQNGTASNVRIVEQEWGGAALIGYGHAVYAYRFPSGEVVTFTSWASKGGSGRNAGSQSTKAQFGKMGLKTMADHTVEQCPSKSTFEPHEWEYLILDESQPAAMP